MMGHGRHMGRGDLAKKINPPRAPAEHLGRTPWQKGLGVGPDYSSPLPFPLTFKTQRSATVSVPKTPLVAKSNTGEFHSVPAEASAGTHSRNASVPLLGATPGLCGLRSVCPDGR